MTTCLGKSCSFGSLRVPFVNCCQFMYLVISLLVLRAGCGIWLYQFLIIAYLFILHHQFYIISDLALRTIFKGHRVTFCWPIFSQYIGMRLLPLQVVSVREIWTLLKTVGINITSNVWYRDFKIHLYHVKKIDWLGIWQHLEIFTNIILKSGRNKNWWVSTVVQYITIE